MAPKHPLSTSSSHRFTLPAPLSLNPVPPSPSPDPSLRQPLPPSLPTYLPTYPPALPPSFAPFLPSARRPFFCSLLLHPSSPPSTPPLFLSFPFSLSCSLLSTKLKAAVAGLSHGTGRRHGQSRGPAVLGGRRRCRWNWPGPRQPVHCSGVQQPIVHLPIS